MQRPYWSHQKMSIRDLRQRNEHNRRQCRQAVPWRHWGVYRWLPPSRGYGCWGHHCTLYIPQAPAATRSMSPRTPRRVPHHQPLVGDRVNATAVEMMPTRIPHSFASRAIVHHISPRLREEEQVRVFFFRRRGARGRTLTTSGASCHSCWKLPDDLELRREPFWSTYVLSAISRYFVSVPSLVSSPCGWHSDGCATSVTQFRVRGLLVYKSFAQAVGLVNSLNRNQVFFSGFEKITRIIAHQKIKHQIAQI